MSEPSTPRNTTYLQRAYALNGDAQAQHFYDEWADAYETDNNGLGYASPRRTVEVILKNVTGDAHDAKLKVLDAGCGTGLVGACLAQSALAGQFVLDGLDLSPGMLAAARQKGVYRELEEANLNERIKKPDGSYDLVVCVGTLTVGHVGPGVLREFARVAAPLGLIVATVHSSIWESKGYKAEIETLRDTGTVQVVSTDEFGLVEEASTGGIMVVLRKN
ncbi:unnamed protein product [Clonostachys chloroleuca]|uniref:Methyltransferase domain-containing protein n=1 Tax=Clonostachys chloroleuca TaxID=1926264 RepID=A0AA35VMK5_9HYPO|nr:unnamed protein product [Clonostachys chloroleuca]